MSSLDNSYRRLTSSGEHQEKIESAISLFNELKTVTRTSVFGLNAIYPLSLFRDVTTGTVTHNKDRYSLAPGASLETAKIGRYVSGYSAEAGIGIIKDAGAEARFGLFNLNNGFFVEDTIANGFRIGNRRAGVDEIYDSSSNFFIDKLDGRGYSGITYDPEEGYIFQIDFPYYGFGPIIFSISKRTGPITERMMYPFAVLNVAGNTSTENPNLPVRAENLGSSGQVHVTGRQYSIVGEVQFPTRKTGATSNLVSLDNTAFKPIISFRRKAGTEFEFFTIATDFLKILNGASDIEYQLILNGTLTGAVPFTPDNRSPGETSIEFDRSATAITGGEQFYSDVLAGTGNNKEMIFDKDEERVEVPRDYWVTLVGKTLNSGETSSAKAHLRALEEF